MRRPNGLFRCGAVLLLTVVGVLGCDASAFASSQTFVPERGPEQQFTVPAGVTQIQVTAVGGAGQQGSECAAGGGGAGGAGAEITAQLPVSEGETLSIEFGGGASSGTILCTATAGGNGGGASRIASDSPSTPLIVAGGGGGGGDGFGTFEPSVATGGAGGSAINLVGGDGAPGSFSSEPGAPQGSGGEGGTDASPGSGGSAGEGPTSGSNGELGVGGAGGSPPEGLGSFGGAGGGGGGGYYGGGGGGAGGVAGGGGGAGSSFIAPSASEGKVAVAETASQEVVIGFSGQPARPARPARQAALARRHPRESTGSTGTGGGGVLGSISTNIGSAQIAALLGQELTPAGRAAKIATLLKTSGFAITFKALEAGTAVIDWYDVPAGAKLAKKTKVEPILVASGQITFPAAGTTTIKIKPTAAGRRLLKNAKSLKLVAKGTFTPTGKAPVIATKAFVLNR